MKLTVVILSVVALLLANAGGERIYRQEKTKKKRTHGFEGIPQNKDEGLANFRQKLRSTKNYVPKYVLDKALPRESVPEIVEMWQPSDKQLGDAEAELERTVSLARKPDASSDEEEASIGAAARSRGDAEALDEFSSTDGDDDDDDAETGAGARAREERSKTRVSPQQGSLSFYNATDAMLMGSTQPAQGQLAESVSKPPASAGDESEAEMEAEMRGFSYQGTFEQGPGQATPQIHEQLKMIPPTKVHLGSGAWGGKQRGRRKNKQIPITTTTPPTHIQPQGRSKKGRGKKNVIFQGSLGDFWKWEDDRQRKK